MVHHIRRDPRLALVLLACLGLVGPATGIERQPAPELGQSGALRVSESADSGMSILSRGFGSIAQPYGPTARCESAGGGMSFKPNGFAVDIGPWIDPDG